MNRNRFITAMVMGGIFLLQACSSGPKHPSPMPWPLKELVASIKASVVTVVNYDLDDTVSSIGSGFFISEEGILLTNYHVLEGAYRAAIRMPDGSQHPVEAVVAKSPLVDLIKVRVAVPDSRIRPIALATEPPAVADRVFVVGSPMGLEQTVSEGIISAIRELPAGGNVLQVTAPISQGSSGGPVLNHSGEAVGVVTFQASRGQNLNFAISADALDGLSEEGPGISIAEWTIRTSRRGPALAASLCSRGAQLSIQGHYEEALTYFERAAESNPEDPEAWYGLGSCYVGLDRSDDAVAAYRRPIEQDPDNATAHFVLAMYYKTTGKYDLEIDALKEVIRIDPTHLRARFEIGRAYGALERTGEQIDAYRSLLKDQPDHIPTLLDLGVALEKAGNPGEAVAHFTQARDLDPSNELIHYNLGVIYNRMDQPEEAIRAYTRAIRANPRMVPAHYNLGVTYLNQGRRELALGQYEILKDLKADMADTLFDHIYPESTD